MTEYQMRVRARECWEWLLKMYRYHIPTLQPYSSIKEGRLLFQVYCIPGLRRRCGHPSHKEEIHVDMDIPYDSGEYHASPEEAIISFFLGCVLQDAQGWTPDWRRSWFEIAGKQCSPA